jgi:hypothetical protein
MLLTIVMQALKSSLVSAMALTTLDVGKFELTFPKG